jgi:uncharacterized phiE125 gp8 family phage protein
MRLRSLVVATHPTVEPVSLAAAKAHLGLLPEQEDDHAQILAMIATARRLVEKRLGVALVPQQLRARFDHSDGDGWSRGPAGIGPITLRLPVTPILVGNAYPVAVDVDGVAVSSSTYSVDADGGYLRFSTAPSVSELATLTVTYWAGQEILSPQLRSAILLYVGHLYLNREASAAGAVADVPLAFETLLASESVTGRW